MHELRGRGSSGVWHHGEQDVQSTAALDPGALYKTVVSEGGCRVLCVRVGEEKIKGFGKPASSEEERDRRGGQGYEVTPGMTVGSL